MDSFKQQKLTRSEWISIEKPIDEKEKIILRMIYAGSTNPPPIYIYNIINNVVHLEHEEKEYYIYVYLLKEDIDILIKKLSLAPINLPIPKKKLNSSDKIRIENQKSKLSENVEYTVIQIINSFHKEFNGKKHNTELYYYNMCYLYNTYTINKYLRCIVEQIIEK